MGIFNGIPDNKNLLKKFVDGFTSVDNQKDYKHASELMRPNGMALAPNTKFNFHVFFTLNDKVPNISAKDKGLIGALVKTVQLPSYKLDTKEYIQYNRKRLVHNRIEYDPVTLTLHDDASDTVRSMWYDYYQYYFADANYEYESGQSKTTDGKTDYSGRDLYDPTRSHQSAGWGITSASPTGITKLSFFKDITVYGMSRGNYMAYTLINPVITSWQHDQYDYASDSTMEHKMTVKYEAVKYYTGKVQDSKGINVKGFAEKSRYDNEPGILGKSGDAEIDINGNPIAGGAGLVNDLASGNYLGAVRTALQGRDLLNGDNLEKAATGEVIGNVAKGIARYKWGFPKASSYPPSLGGPSKPKKDPKI